MRHTDVSYLLRALGVVATLTWTLSACSGSQSSEDKLENEASDEASAENGDEAKAEGDEATAESNEAPSDGGDVATSDVPEAEPVEETAAAAPMMDMATTSSPVDTQGAGMAAETEAAPAAPTEAAAPVAQTAPAPAAQPTPAPAAQPTPASSGWVVRYVKAETLDIRSQPTDSAPAVGTLRKGDHLMVVEQNGWGRVSDNMFVKLSDLSNRAIPRRREPARWLPPAH